MGMCWSNFNPSDDEVRYTDGSTGKKHALPIRRRLREHFLTLPRKEAADQCLCPSLVEKCNDGKTGLSRRFPATMAEAGVEERRVEIEVLHKAEEKKARNLPRWSFHAILHSFNSELANA